MRTLHVSAAAIAFMMLTTQTLADEVTLSRAGRVGVGLATDEEGQVFARRVLEGSAAFAGGLQEGDILLKINAKDITNRDQGMAKMARLKEGLKAELLIQRNGKEIALEVFPGNKPLPQMEGAEVVANHVTLNSGIRVRTFQITPQNLPQGKHPGVLIGDGIYCASIEGFGRQNHPLQRLVSTLVSEGFIVLMVEKPGIGDSEGPDCRDAGFHNEVEASSKALKAFSEQSNVDPDRLYMIGISMGSMQSPLIARDVPMAGIISWGGNTDPWGEYLTNVTKYQMELFSDPEERIENTHSAYSQFFSQVINEGKTPNEVTLRPSSLTEVVAFEPERPFGRHYSFHQEIGTIDMKETWRTFPGKALIMHGEFDWVSPENYNREINNLAKNSEFVQVPGLTHGFLKYETLQQSLNVTGENGQPSNDAFEVMVNWLKAEALKKG